VAQEARTSSEEEEAEDEREIEVDGAPLVANGVDVGG